MAYKVREIGLLVCNRCGQSVEIVNAGHRKYCPDCAKIMKKEQQRAIRKAHQEAERQRRQAAESKAYGIIELRKRQDADLNARIAKQHKQCLHCDNAHHDGGFVYCNYISIHGHSRPKGGTPGNCAGFEQWKKTGPKGLSLRRKRNAGAAAIV